MSLSERSGVSVKRLRRYEDRAALSGEKDFRETDPRFGADT